MNVPLKWFGGREGARIFCLFNGIGSSLNLKGNSYSEIKIKLPELLHKLNNMHKVLIESLWEIVRWKGLKLKYPDANEMASLKILTATSTAYIVKNELVCKYK